MANAEHLKILKEGVEVWNAWREENSGVRPDLSHASLQDLDLEAVNFQNANLSFANLSYSDLQDANLNSAHLYHIDLTFADLFSANLNSANLNSANLISANLNSADLISAKLNLANLSLADLTLADLDSANLSSADLDSANLNFAELNDAVFYKVRTWNTIFNNVDLRLVKDLETIKHEGPSDIGQSTLQKSQGQIPEIFLRGCGMSKWEIAASKLYNPNLTPRQITDLVYQIDEYKNSNPIQMQNLFISYNHEDAAFVDALEVFLRMRDIYFWRDIHNPLSGRLEKVIDRAMQLNQIVVIVLSEHAAKSEWVEWEVNKAIQYQKNAGHDMLCPIALDDSWKNARWSGPIKNQIMKYRILDFSEWRDPAKLKWQFENMVKGLNLFYRKE